MPWVATLLALGAEGSNPNVVATLLLTNTGTNETQNRTLVSSKLTMKDIEAFAVNQVALLDQRDKNVAFFQPIIDAIAAGKELVLAQPTADLTAADAT